MSECRRCGLEIEEREPTSKVAEGDVEHLMWADCFRAVRNDERHKIIDEVVSFQEYELAARIKEGMRK